MWNGGEAKYLHWIRWTSCFDRFAGIVEHCADATERSASHNRITDAQSSALDQHGGDRATALIKVSFNGNAPSFGICERTEIKGSVCCEQN